jgi:hypothetical protein
LLAGGALVIAVALAFGLVGRSPQTAASGSPSASPSASPSSTPTASSSAGPAAGKPASALAVVADCGFEYPYAILGDRLIVLCFMMNSEAADEALVQVSLDTGKIVASYPIEAEAVSYIALTSDGLWYSRVLGMCTTNTSCVDNDTVRRDLVTGKITVTLDNWTLVGDGEGYLLARQRGKDGQVARLDPATGAVKGWIPFGYSQMQTACGSVWGIDITRGQMASGASTTASTTLARIDPNNGKVLASFTEPGAIGALQQIGDECWAPAYTESPIDSHANVDLFDHFDRIGQSGIEFRSNKVAVDESSVDLLGGTYWLIDHTHYSDWYQGQPVERTVCVLQRIDPATWQPIGQVWTWTGSDPELAAGGTLWASDEAHSALVRLDIPLTTQ